MPPEELSWWLKYPHKEEQVAKRMLRYRPGIESTARWYDRHYPGPDWEAILMYASYKAMFRCDGNRCWNLIKRYMFMAAKGIIRTWRRRNDTLGRVPLEDDVLWYWDRKDE